MPSLQVVDFGPDPAAENMGKFAQGFSGSFFKAQNQKKNEDIFKRIQKKYGPNAKPEDMLKDIIESEGFDESYKKDLIKDVKDYATLASKRELTPYQEEMLEIRKEELNLKNRKGAEDEKPLTPYQKKNLEIQERRLDKEEARIEQAARNNERKLPKLIADHINTVMKDSEQKFSAGDKALLNQRVLANVADDQMSTSEALAEALEYVDMKNQIVEEAQLAERPVHFYGEPSQAELEKGIEQAYQQLEQLYEAGIESQRDLRAIAKRAGWNPQEITAMLQRIFRRKGKNISSASPTQSARDVSGADQGQAQQAAGVDDILFGE